MDKWFQNAMVYQIYPQSFQDTNADGIGDLNGITQRLDYIRSLGADAIWICPIYDSPNRDNGYDVRNYYALQDRYGTDEDFDRLIQESHKRQLRIIMDLVLNHTSNENPWFLESSESRSGEKQDWYIWRDPKPNGDPPTNWGAIFGGSAWTWCPKRGQYYLHTFSPYQPDLNWENADMRSALYRMVRYWTDRGVDGFRLDAINFIAKDLSFPDGPALANGYANIYPFVANRPRAHHFLAELKQEALQGGKIVTVGEASSATTRDALAFANELDMIFQFEHVALDVSSTVPWGTQIVELPKLKRCLTKWQTALHDKAWNSIFWENHDQPRIVSRLGDEFALREKSAKMLAICMYFMEGTPFVYQGQELGVPNTRFCTREEMRDIEAKNAFSEFVDTGYYTESELLNKLSRRSRDTARTPMLWDATPFAGFSSTQPWIKVNDRFAQINVHEQENRPDSCLQFYRSLFSLRKTLGAVQSGAFILLDESDPDTFSYLREDRDCPIAVICNFRSHSVRVPCGARFAGAKVLLSNTDAVQFPQDGVLQPYDAYVLCDFQRQ